MILSSIRRGSMLRRIAATAVGALALTCGAATAQDLRFAGDDLLPADAGVMTTNATTTSPTGPTRSLTWNARILAPVYARTKPAPKAKRLMLLSPVAPYTHGPTVLLVMDQVKINGVRWTKLLLPRRPNGSTGWVRSDYLRFWPQRMRVLIDQSQRKTYVLRDGEVIFTTRNAVGKAETPTPNGYFSLAEKAYLSPGHFLGPIVLVTTGFSEVLNEYAGGNGRFAMHGTSEPWVIGTRASHGCIRHYNDQIVRISKMIGLGTPIRIRA